MNGIAASAARLPDPCMNAPPRRRGDRLRVARQECTRAPWAPSVWRRRRLAGSSLCALC